MATAIFRMTSAHDFVAGAIAWFPNVSPLRRSCVSSAWNAGKVTFFDLEVQPSAEIVRVVGTKCR